jgi:chitodextrinase
VTGTTSSTAALSWTASSDNVAVTGYDVYRGSTLAATVAGTTFTDTGLTPSTAYSYAVKAHDAAGNQSAASAAITATTAAGSTTGTLLTQGPQRLGLLLRERLLHRQQRRGRQHQHPLEQRLPGQPVDQH